MKSHDREPVDRLLREAYRVDDPTDADLASAEQAFLARVEDPGQPTRSTWPGRLWRSRLVLASAVAVVIMALLGVLLSRPLSAAVALSELAEASRLVEPATIPDQSYAYSKSDAIVLAIIPGEMVGTPGGDVAYLLQVVDEVWVGEEGVAHIQRTASQPRFFDPDVEDRYYANNLDELDGVGETRIETAVGVAGILDERDWPTDPDQLDALLRTLAPEPDRRAQLALALIRETRATPQLRAAALQTMSRLDNITLVDQSDDGYTFEFELALGETPTRYTFTLDREGALLTETETLTQDLPELHIPAGTIISRTTYQPTLIVDTFPNCPNC